MFGVPFSVYSCWMLWKHKSNVLMQKRYPFLLFTTVLYLFLMLSRNAFIADGVCVLQSWCDNMTDKLDAALRALLVIPVVLIFTTRVFFLWFDLKWNHRISNLEWWKHINLKQASWFTKHKTTIGSFNHFMSKYICAGYIIYMLLFGILLIVTEPGMTNMIETLFVRAPIVFSMVLCPTLLYLMPSSDTIRIRYELTIIIAIWEFSCIYFSMTGPLDLQRKYQFMAILTSAMNIAMVFVLTYLSILYPINRLILKDDIELKLSNPTSHWSIYICESSKNFNQFMSFLVKEIAIENLCFVLEICQLKKQYHTKDNSDTETDTDIGFYLELPDDLPLSSILQESTDLDQRIVLLYNKYVIDSAQLQLNISYASKQQITENVVALQQQNENVDKDDMELLLIYENILVEVQLLLQSSWIRFQKSEIGK